MGFAYLNALENEITSLQSNLSSYKSQLNTQNSIKSDIESIIKNIKNVGNSKAEDVNYYLNKIINNFENAAKGVPSIGNLVSTVTYNKERDVYVDVSLNDALTQLQLEIAEIERKISEIESNIRSTNERISSCQYSVRSEKHNIALDYKNQYNTAQSKVNTAYAAYKADPDSAKKKNAYKQACRDRDNARNTYNRYMWWL